MPDEGYHLNADLADQAIEFISDAHTNAPDKPFFLYFCHRCRARPPPGRAGVDRPLRRAFDMGWDEYRRIAFSASSTSACSPRHRAVRRDPDVPPWDSLSDDAKRMYARQMEVFAGFMSQTDHHIGRVLDFIELAGRARTTRS